MSKPPFFFQQPSWANSGRGPENPKEQLKRAEDLAESYYALGVQSGVHSMIEWCGVMGEYVKMLEHALVNNGIEPAEVDQHHDDCKVSVPPYMIQYFTEKLGCQLKPFIRANPEMWRTAIEDWFEGKTF